ncbi:hypothetical protein GCM10011507_34450 [Edaphobacter acidisoli]|uniref:Uncharacterized protein n=2 Tax=Edaphobacter acidisoli TaxID=2040573 RepID=A0A916S1P9_9BACT|nr:hypothetical protein GCM10011507_34450 [Edaphobacter acidisoli]
MHSVISVVVDTANNIYIVDADNYCIRKVTAGTGIITTVVGNGTPGYSGDGGPATSAQLSPSGIAVDAVGNLYITDAGAEVIRKVTAATGIITTIAGNGSYGYSGDGGLATAAKLGDPQGIALDASGNIYFADSNNNVVREINASTGIITTIAGNGAATYAGDGGPATAASIHYPVGVAIDSASNIYIAEQYSDRIREVTASTGIISTIAGNGTLGYTGDGGAATSATLSMPSGVTFDTSGNMYIADNGNSVVRAVKASSGIILTVAGNGLIGYTGDNEPATTVALYFPSNVAVDGNGNLDIADTNNSMVRQVAAPIIWDPSAFDAGTVTLTVGGVSESATYNSTTNTTSSAIAAALESALNTDPNSQVTATLSGSTLTLTSKQPGASSDYSYSLASTYDSQDFAQGSFSANPSSGSLTGGTDPSTVATPVYSYSMLSPNLGYDLNGNLLGYTDSVMGTWTFGYDGLNRLASGTATPAYGQNSYYCWSYDSFGNRTNQSGSDQSIAGGGTSPCQPASSASITTDIASYNSANQILSTNASGTTVAPSYDPAGNIIGDGSHVYLYDPDGRICAVGTPAAPPLDATSMTQYLYDVEGHRVAKGTISVWSCDVSSNGFTLTNQYILGPSGEQMTELDGSGNPIHTNVYVNGSLLATYDNQGLHFHLTDWLGTRRAQTNFAGSLEATYMGMPFGEMPIGQSSGPTEQHFTGKERDSESGLDYFGARYYDSSMGRFMSPDATGPNPGNPQALNLYRYGFNNPLRYTDPDGFYEQDVHLDLTQALAYAAGYSSYESGVIARADQGVDESKATNPWNGYGFLGSGARRDFHFTTSERRAEMWNSFESTSDSLGEGYGGEALGAYLHAEQDSYSHAGFGPLFGHLFAFLLPGMQGNGHAPDKTYTDPGKADTMARDTYGALLQAGVKMGTEAGPVPLAGIMPFVQAFNRANTKEGKDTQLQNLKQYVQQYRKDHKDDPPSNRPSNNSGYCSAEYSHC